MSAPASARSRSIDRYALYEEIAAGGMASVHFGRLMGPAGFARTVAIKQLHPTYARDPEFVAMLLDEARLAARVRHPNVVPTLDVVAQDDELFVVMEYVEGESLARLMRRAHEKNQRIPLPVVIAVISGVLHGLHAAHEARGENGEALNIVHRDVSPQNVLVGIDGVARVLDFGIAKAVGRSQTTRDGKIKGKLGYMPPEQVQGAVTRRTDVYAAAVVLWECLVGERLFTGENAAATLQRIMAGEVKPPSTIVPEIPRAFDDVVMKGLKKDPRERFATAREMANALEACGVSATPAEVGDWVTEIAHDAITRRSEAIKEIESDSGRGHRLRDIVKTLPADETEVDARPPVHVPSTPPRTPSSTRSRVLVVSLLALVAASIVFALTRTHHDPPEKQGDSSSSPLPASTASTGAPSAAPLVTSASAPPLVSTSSVAPTTKHVPAKTKPNCNPAYVYDANGKKQYKPECL